MHSGFWWGNIRERDHLKYVGIDGSLFLISILREWDRWGLEWIDLAQDRNRWLDSLIHVMNPWGT